MRSLLVLIALFVLQFQGYAQTTLRLNSTSENIDLLSYIEIFADTTEKLTFDKVVASDFQNKFHALKTAELNYNASVHWLKFTLFNELPYEEEYNLSVPFTDYITLYSTIDDRGYVIERTGDLVVLPDRSRQLGKLVVLKFRVPPGQEKTYYMKLESTTNISQQFKSFALGAIRLYSEQGYTKRFEKVRIFHSLFFGAILIMLLYNFFIYLSLRDRSYLYYVFFIFLLLLFLAADEGILAELFFAYHPRIDLYIRFVSTPLLLLAYLRFSKSYLKSKHFLPQVDKGVTAIMVYFGLLVLLMITGYWRLGRSLSIIGAVISFLTILGIAIAVLNKGYKPATYFLAANLLLLLGGIVFAMQRYFVVAQNPITQYSVQISAVLQVALFSLGLADRINLVRQELIERTLENEKLERQKELELKRIIEEKNQELEQKVLVRTSEVVEQKEEIEAQKESLLLYNEELEKAQEVIKSQNKELSTMNSWLESQVKDRTRKLEHSNDELQKAVEELDNFIYKTAHDIRGPLARLMGLCNVAILDVSDKKALKYFNLLDGNANHLNIILSRLSTIHKIKHLAIENQPISFEEILKNVLEEKRSLEKFKAISFDISIAEALNFQSDPYLIKLILGNLIENAIKYSDPDKKRNAFIKISIKKEGDFLEISIVDNGIGLKKAEIPHLFEMFSHAADVHQSAGLGLYMVKISVHKLQGSIAVKPDLKDNHTHFFIRLPVVWKEAHSSVNFPL